MIKTRFAPSPTGFVHIGSLRTALYSYLFAKKHNGKFILRIEDTDQARFVEGALENLLKTLHWAGLEYDEGPLPEGPEKGEYGPYIQSHRHEIYEKYAQQLLDDGHAYRCFCTKERLDEMRENQKKNNQPTMYDRKCLQLSNEEINAKIENKEPFIVRQKIPYTPIKFKDLIRGNVQFDGKTIDDQVLVKSDGLPTYHLANVVDDHLMEITHVIRGEEWLPSAPKHVALYEAFGWERPEFAHIPLLLNEDRSKLSKRQGDVAVEEYIKKGYLKEALINFVAFLGWNPGGGSTTEIYSLEELCQVFSLEKVHKAGAVFNIEKLNWFNWQWQRKFFEEKLTTLAKKLEENVEIIKDNKGKLNFKFQLPANEEVFNEEKGKFLKEICSNHLEESFSSPLLSKALCTVDEKILKDPASVNEEIGFYFKPSEYDKVLLTHEKMGVNFDQAKQSIQASIQDLEQLDTWSLQSLESTLLGTVQKLNAKNGQVFWPVRAALSTLPFSPGVFEISWVLGKEESIKRLKTALDKLNSVV